MRVAIDARRLHHGDHARVQGRMSSGVRMAAAAAAARP